MWLESLSKMSGLPSLSRTTCIGVLLVLSLLGNAILILGKYFPPSSPTSRSSPAGQILTQTVEKIIDGDTIDTVGGLRVRLALIESPEYPKDCLSLQAKQRLETLILGKEVTIESLKKDNFGRTIGFVSEGDTLINKTLVTEGYAAVVDHPDDTRYTHELELSQKDARAAARGIWSSLCQNQKDDGCAIKGNYRADKRSKIYHTPECFNYDKISINLKEKDQWFCTEADAQKAGFIKSEDCP